MEITVDEELVQKMRDWLRDYINHACIYRVKPDEPKLVGKARNTFYTWQFYLRRGLFNAKFLNMVGILFWYEYAEKYKETPFQVTGLETGATPILSAITMTSHLFDIDVNVISTRAERKKYGLKNRFEGIIDYSLPVLIVDDMCNSKDTLLRCINHVAAEGLQVCEEGWVIVNKDMDGSHADHDKYIGDGGFKVNSIFKISDFEPKWDDYITKHGNVSEIEFIPERSTNG
jgi:orotate phosphoribosyltransferase